MFQLRNIFLSFRNIVNSSSVLRFVHVHKILFYRKVFSDIQLEAEKKAINWATRKTLLPVYECNGNILVREESRHDHQLLYYYRDDCGALA
ncbi:CLUMA_CG019856, isoform A [Clunio marinus]|uniref:CLUMA_CG019856, isoform A n=1 Tax=Clunio marinus TaxID=568069 RepID=A0A1J1J4Z9_9DIPT|nr:CLUMA_CG019856, isoform A [Clunio marinus]